MKLLQEILNLLPGEFQWDLNNPLWEQMINEQEREYIEFIYPKKTVPIKCIETCQLNCAHCGGEYLKNMLPLSKMNQQKHATSFLISGGCDTSGKVPLENELNEIAKYKKSHKLNCHVGLLDDNDIRKIADVMEIISFDFVYNDKTIKSVYGIEATKEDYLDTYRKLSKHTNVVPHICIGLNGGVIEGEMDALECLQFEGIATLVFIVFIPTANTRFAEKSPPPLGQTVELLAQARTMFPDASLHLGCMRPSGKYRYWLDALAVITGINRIVHPTPLARQIAQQLELKVLIKEECCVF